LAELIEPAERLLKERRALAEALARAPYEEERRRERKREEEAYWDEREREIEALHGHRKAAAFRAEHPELMGGQDHHGSSPRPPIELKGLDEFVERPAEAMAQDDIGQAGPMPPVADAS
jgi:hypothetical protein